MAAALACATPALALDPNRGITQYVLDVWQTDQGLPDVGVFSIVQTRDGYLWLATDGGLTRFDGVRFTVLSKANTPVLASDQIHVLREGRDGSLWFGTEHGGLYRLKDGLVTSFTKDLPLGDVLVRAIHENEDGTLLIGTEGGGLSRLKDGRFTTITSREGLLSDDVISILDDGRGTLWIGTSGGGLTRIPLAAVPGLFGGPAARPQDLSHFTAKDGLRNGRVKPTLLDREGNLWIGTDGGLHRLKDGALTVFTTKDGLGRDLILSIHQDRAGNLWVGTYGGGLSRLKSDGTFETLTTRQGLSEDRVYSILEDREGSLWLGTGGGGLNRLRDGKVICFNTWEGLSSDQTFSILETRAGDLFIGTVTGGLNRLRDGRFTSWKAADGLWSDRAGSLFEDRSGTLWIESPPGVNRLKDGKLTKVEIEVEGSRLNRPILEDRHGDVWIGLWGGGLVRLPGGQGPAIPLPGLPKSQVLALLEGHEGSLWIGTDRKGLHRLKDGTLTSYTKKDGLSNDRIWALHEDREGTLWIATFGAGLNRLKDGRVTALAPRIGLERDTTCRILEDDHGSLWAGGDHGIVRLDKRQLNDVADGRPTAVTPEIFGMPEGMRIAECSAGSQPDGWKARDGRLWFPTSKGVVVFDPARIPRNSIPPPVLLEDVVVNGRLTRPPATGTLALPPVEKLEIHYTALSYLVPRRVRFRYLLEGFDRDWSDVGTERMVRYTNLPPRAYTFRVRACNDDGVWNETGATLSFTVRPFVYQTWWFYVLVALGLVGVGVFAQRVRVSRLKAQREELHRVVEERTASLAERTRNLEVERQRSETERLKAESANRAKSVFLANMSHELRTPLNAVLGFAQLMGRKRGRDEEDLEHLAIIGRSGEHLLGLLNDALSLSKVEAGAVTISPSTFEPALLLRGLGEMLRVRAEGKGLDLVCEPPDGFPPAVVGDEGKLRQILINLLGNAVKFTERGRVVFRARWREGEARFEVQDTGPGLSAEEREKLFQPFVQTESGRKAAEGTGLGLTISRSFARLMGGDLDVTSEPGKGSLFTLTLPLSRADEAVTSRRRRERRHVIGLAAGQAPRRILVADDVLENRLLLTRLLSSTGFQVSEAVDGAEAIRRWEAERPDLILMDVRMPVLDGLAATRRIREAEASGKGQPVPVKIIALSASALQHERGDILAAGCDDFLAKPFRDAAVFDKVGELLGVRFEYETPGREDTPGEATPREGERGNAGVLTPERLAAVSAGLLARLSAAVKLGDDEEAARVAEEISREDAALGEALGKAVREFQLSRLLTLMERMTP